MDRLSAELLETVIGFLPDHLVVGRLTATHRASWQAHRGARRYTEACWRALQDYLEEQQRDCLQLQDEAEMRRQEDEEAQLTAFLAEMYDPGTYSEDD